MSRSFIVRVIVPAIAVVGLLVQPARADQGPCWSSDEIPAARLHAFQTMLMVGAMRCQYDRPDALKSHNAFIQSRKSSIEVARTVLQAHFIRELGAQDGATAFRAFDTKVGNLVSGSDDNALSCDAIGTYSRLAVSASEVDLYTLASLNAERLDIHPCLTDSAMALPTNPAPKTSAQGGQEPSGLTPTSETTGTSAEAPKLASAEHGQVDNAAPPEVKAAAQAQEGKSDAQPQTIANKEPAAGNGNADAAAALQEAARALAAAATSLRMASSANH